MNLAEVNPKFEWMNLAVYRRHNRRLVKENRKMRVSNAFKAKEDAVSVFLIMQLYEECALKCGWRMIDKPALMTPDYKWMTRGCIEAGAVNWSSCEGL